jgi:hypothetical protein
MRVERRAKSTKRVGGWKKRSDIMFVDQFAKTAEKYLEGGFNSGCPLKVINNNSNDFNLSSDEIQMLKEFAKTCPQVKTAVEMWRRDALQELKKDIRRNPEGFAKALRDGATTADLLARIDKNDMGNMRFDLDACGIVDMEHHKDENRSCWFKFGQHLMLHKIQESIRSMEH